MPDHMNSFHTNNLSWLNCFSWHPCLCHATTMMRSGLESEGDPAPAPRDKTMLLTTWTVFTYVEGEGLGLRLYANQKGDMGMRPYKHTPASPNKCHGIVTAKVSTLIYT